jgi:hypothetical protein
MFGIKMQNHSCDFTPVSTLRIRVEQAQIRDHVLLVVSGQNGIGGRGIGDIGIKRRLLHGQRVVDLINFALSHGILMTRTGEVRFAPINGCVSSSRQVRKCHYRTKGWESNPWKRVWRAFDCVVYHALRGICVRWRNSPQCGSNADCRRYWPPMSPAIRV